MAKVVLTEHERGWGQKILDEIYFETRAEADDYAYRYNAQWNTEEVAPNWYIAAHAED